MNLIHFQRIPEKPGQKPWKITGYIFAWVFSLLIWTTLLLVAYDRLSIFVGRP